MFLEKGGRLPEEKERDFTVRQYKRVYGIGALIMGAAVLLLVLEIKYHLTVIPIWIYMVILAVFLLGAMVCLETRNRQLAVAGNRLGYSNLFGKVRFFAMEDIVSARAAANPSGGRDYLRLYGKDGKILCRLECSMQNADRMVCCLCDNGIPVEMEKNARPAFMDITAQKTMAEENLRSRSEEVYRQAEALIEEWMERNRKLGADLIYGFAEYYGNRVDPGAQIQPSESRLVQETGELPEDYLCVWEIYIQKDGYFVQDRKKQWLILDFPVFYKRKAWTAEKEVRLYYNEGWQEELEDVLRFLAKYLPGHRFALERMEMGYELRKTAGRR